MSATQEIVRWLLSTHYNDIPADVVEAANSSCFDCVGTILAGSDEALGKIMTGYAASFGGKEESRYRGARSKCPEIEGSSINPFTPERLQAKFRSNAARALSPDLVDKAVKCWMDFRTIEDISFAVKSVCIR